MWFWHQICLVQHEQQRKTREAVEDIVTVASQGDLASLSSQGGISLRASDSTRSIIPSVHTHQIMYSSKPRAKHYTEVSENIEHWQHWITHKQKGGYPGIMNKKESIQLWGMMLKHQQTCHVMREQTATSTMTGNNSSGYKKIFPSSINSFFLTEMNEKS